MCHGEDLFYLFHPHMMKDFDLPLPAPNSVDYKMINCLTQMWTDFAKTGCDKFNITSNITEIL